MNNVIFTSENRVCFLLRKKKIIISKDFLLLSKHITYDQLELIAKKKKNLKENYI